MGCDIHMVLETKMNGKWIGVHAYPWLSMESLRFYGENQPDKHTHFGFVATSRNYALFAAIAGVRGESEFNNEPRGLPADASDLAQAMSDNYGEDGHSHSWMLLPEFLKCYGWAVTEEGSEARKQAALDAVSDKIPFENLAEEVTGLRYLTDDNPLENYRLVFWFDN